MESVDELLPFMPIELAMPLHEALSLSRSDCSETEGSFVAWLVGWCSQYACLKMIDNAGNVHFEIPNGDKRSKTLFVAHTDTVAWSDGPNPYYIYKGWLKAAGDVLGADDGAGCALLCYMMSQGVPGRYIFSRQEESGGLGSEYTVANHRGLLENFDRAIAFDRRGTSEVINIQGGQVCASDAAADALSDALNDLGMMYMPSDRGSFTDTKLFRKIIPECFNIAVGYEDEHGGKERLNLAHFAELAAAVIQLDWEALPVARNPRKVLDLADFRRPPSMPSVLNGLPLEEYWDLGDDTQQVLTEAPEVYVSVHELAEAWLGGNTQDLKDFLCRELYPKDMDMARRVLNFSNLRDYVIDEVFIREEEDAIEYLLDKCMIV